MLYVRDITQLPLLKTSKVKSGKDVLGNKKIEWVSVIESPVENFVRENEFVLTTGIGCHEDLDILLEFVKDVYDSGASALAIATGRYIFEIPDEIIQFAEERNFILIEIPWEIRFADIVHEVMRELNQIQQNDLKRSKDVHQNLIQMILDGKNIGEISSYVEEELGLPILILNEKGSPTAGSANPTKVFSIRNRLIRMHQDKKASQHPLHSKMKTISDEDSSLYHLSIQTNGVHEGEICVLTDLEYQLNQQDIHIIEHAMMASALWFSRNSVVTRAEMRLQNDFLLRLIKGESLSEEYKNAKAEQFQYNLNTDYDCIIGYPENLDSLMEKDHKKQSLKYNWLEKMIVYLKEELIFAAEAVKHQMLFAYEGNQIIIFLEVKKESSSDSVNHFLDLVERRLNHLFPSVTFSWGIGKYKEENQDFSHSFKKAKAALDMGRKQIGIGKRVNFDETRMNRLLLNLAINAEVKEIMAATILPLVEYDEKRDMDLINTFIGYNRNSGNVSQTARDLNLHRQSLLYRLRKIESLTGLSLVNPDDLFLLDFSIRVWSTGVIKREQINTDLSNIDGL
ncbi:purine catabolism regulator [Lysinibacillus composti]|uniref:PucR family transcriptional regulator n=1 Tax=Lysinibacillus composti TaxID=720633 RepID=A0A3N9UC59_9BACI|nr:PucR family transcriptional regulator [Lysinibacillus composti]MBM7609305.1 purine catabolism regulator [Lysinibacillus composti]RQW74049.1 PucR family transcriptional regulator [Lysinibacillus composti]